MRATEAVSGLSTAVTRENQSTVIFTQTSEFNSISDGARDLEAEIEWNEIKHMAKLLQCRVSKDVVQTRTQSDYDRLLVFAAAKSQVHSDRTVDLSQIVLRLNGYDLNYWALQFKKMSWFEEPSEIARVAHAFCTLFGLVTL
jgi:hypothetical protein